MLFGEVYTSLRNVVHRRATRMRERERERTAASAPAARIEAAVLTQRTKLS